MTHLVAVRAVDETNRTSQLHPDNGLKEASRVYVQTNINLIGPVGMDMGVESSFF